MPNRTSIKIFFSMLIFTFSISLITLIGFIDTKSSFQSYKFEQFTTLINIEKDKIEESLNDGYELQTYIGYRRLVERIINLDRSVLGVKIYDNSNNKIFYLESKKYSLKNITVLKQSKNLIIYETDKAYIIKSQINFKKDSSRGYILTILEKKTFIEELHHEFYLLLYLFIVIFVAILLYLYIHKKEQSRSSYMRLLKILVVTQIFYIFVLLFLTNSLLIHTIVNQNKILANNIAIEINFANSLGIPIDKISQIDTTFKQYIEDYRSLEWINIKKGDSYLYDIEKPDISLIDNSFKLSNKNLTMHFSTPMNLVYDKILENIKNFLFLLFASTLISYYLFNTLLVDSSHTEKTEMWKNELLLVKPLLFFIFLIETLNISFLPEYFRQIVELSDMDISYIKYLFTIYFAFFVLSFFPATQVVRKYGTKITYILSVFFAGCGAALLFNYQDFYTVMVARAFSGISLGFALIATENHLICSLPIKQRQRISATTGVLYSSAMICGAILGSLVATYIDVHFLFLFEFILAVSVGFYILIFITNKHIAKVKKSILTLKEKFKLFQDWDFIKTIFCAGFFSKVTLSGVIFFALPLILTKYEFTKSEIGQVVVFYSIGILIGGVLVSRYKIAKVNQKPLVVGLLLSSFSMISIGLLDFIDDSIFMTPVLVVSLSLLGVSHSIISSYLLPNIFNFRITKHLGISHVRPFVLTCERGGNIFGPLIMMELLLMFDYSFIPILIFGLVASVFAIIQKL